VDDGRTSATRRRTILLGAVFVGALALLPHAQGTVGATCARDEQGQVRVVGRTLKPATITIGPGKSVTWIACGAGNRRVASTTGAWSPFTLRPSQQKRIVFTRVGRYPYKVDGKTQGLVVVTVAGTAKPPGSSGQAERTVRYDVRVVANYRYTQTLDGGRVETSFAYVGRWTNVLVKIYDAFGTVTAVGRSERGTIDSKLTYSDARGETHCQGSVDYPGYRALAAITGGRPRGQPAYFNFASNLVDDGPFMDLTDARTAACDDLPASDGRTVWLDNAFTVAPGIVIDPPGAGVAETDARFRRQGGTGIPFPLDRVRDGKAFRVAGQRTIGPRTCGAGCTEGSTGTVEFVFTPRR
jgi:plastocyanin